MTIQFSRRLTPAHRDPGLTTPLRVSLSWRERQRSRIAVMLDSGQAVAIVLPRGETLEHNDWVVSESGESLHIEAAPEELMEITASTPFDLSRLIYHLANRHVSAMLTPTAFYIEPDPVLADLVRHLGGRVQLARRPFSPEKGAYHGTSGRPMHSHSAAESHPHHGELDETDRLLGRVGEELSKQAHAK